MAAAELATMSTDGDPPEPVTILAVDDDPTSRMLTRATLEGQLGRVVEAENGLLGVQTLERQDFDLAVVDLDMPVMDGFGFIERARARPQTRHLPIIVVTGRDDVVAIERAFALGATSFLCKPINWNVFRHQVSYVLKVARREREARDAKDAAERLAAFQERAVDALAREVEAAIAKITFLSVKGPDAPLADIFTTGERLQHVLARLRRISNIVTGAVSVRLDIQPAADIAAQAVQAVRERLGSEAVSRIDLHVDAQQEVFCDRALAIEALEEVLTNALANSPATAKVQFKVVDAPHDRVRFEVQDRGSGLPERMLEGDFEPFVTEEGEAHGLRLGLPIAKAILDRHQGHFGVMSEPGRGTEVFLSFPAHTAWEQGEEAIKDLRRISQTGFPITEKSSAT